jgi:hypothetical protein
MNDRRIALLRGGRLQTGAALGLAGLTVGVIAASSSSQTEIAGRFAIVGAVLFAVALALGSPRFVGLATLPVLGGALMASAAAPEPAWVRSIVLGSLWYVAVEVAWDAIERRDGAERSVALDHRRTHEVATVMMLSLVTTTAGFLLSFLAPTRSLLVVGLVILGLLVALTRATQLLSDQFRRGRPGSLDQTAVHSDGN